MRAFRPDVTHLHDSHAIAAGLMAARLQRSGRLVATRRVDFPLRSALSQRKYRSCDRVIAVSRAIAAVLEGHGVPAERLRLVYEGVPARPPRPGGRQALEALGVPPGAPIVGNVAALTDHKDHATLLEAAPLVLARVPEARFVDRGRRRAARRSRSTRAAPRARRPLSSSPASATTSIALMPAFTVFCLSSHSEGLGTSLLDAMNFARPIVATAAGGIPEAVEEGVTGRVVPIRDVAGAGRRPRRRAVRRRGGARRWGAPARRRFEERFTAERMVEETLRVYAERL